MKKKSGANVIAEPSLAELLQKFLDESATAKPASDNPRRDAIRLLERCLNEYAYLNLSREEKVFYDENILAAGVNKSFCQIFGPDKVAVNIRHFVTTFLLCQSIVSASVLERTAKVTEQFCKWIVANNLASAESMTIPIGLALRAGKDLPRALKAQGMISKECEKYHGRDSRLNKALGTASISRIESHRIWLQPDEGKSFGPIALSPKIIENLDADWEIDCSIRQFGKEWKIVEVGIIYPQ